MRVLLDENLPHDLVPLLTGHQVRTVQGCGWAGVQNGELLRRAAGLFDVLVTMDSNMVHQQTRSDLPFAVLIVRARSNRMVDLLPILPALAAALAAAKPGEVSYAEAHR